MSEKPVDQAPAEQKDTQNAPNANAGKQGGKKGGNKGGNKGGGKKGGGKKGGKKGGSNKANVKLEDFPLPDYVAHRCAVWDRVKAATEVPAPGGAIVISLPSGDEKEGVANETTPLDIANGISKGLAQKCVVAKLSWKEGEEEKEAMWDMRRPIEQSCTLTLCTFDTPEGKHAFWHSSAHILGQALERKYKGQLCIGPPIETPGGFYYDMAMDDDVAVSDEDYAILNGIVGKVTSEKQPFERLVISKEDALEMFKYNKYKTEIISSKVPDGENCTAYRCGPLIDLCRGPHVQHTGNVKSFQVTNNSSAYWLGKAENDSLQRVYGISFPDNKLMNAHLARMEELKLRDHRRIGKLQELFFFDQSSPGSCFFLPHGARIYNRLQELLRKEYHARGFSEVVTPNMYSKELFETSGHWQNYKDDMFTLTAEKQEFALKPMNCPGHCIIFGHRSRSYKELPIRFADFGVLHRNELSGTLTGLTRVRRFQQDDAHIFCLNSQIGGEIANALEFMKSIYGVFGFQFDLELSTRPEKKYLGDIAVWDAAEKSLAEVLDQSGFPWKLNPGDGAFYGPKIDIHITDAMGRSHQCATIQLDFQLPLRFNLEYVSESGGSERPVIIHRAIYGSLERFIAILTEHTAGLWPLWISPRQLLIVPVSPDQFEYANALQKRFHDAGFYVEANVSTGEKFAKKMAVVRENKLYNYVLVVGKTEMEKDQVNVRTRDNEELGAKGVNDFIAQLQEEVSSYHNEAVCSTATE